MRRKQGTAFEKQKNLRLWWRCWRNDLGVYANKWSRSVDFYRFHIKSYGILEYIKRKFEADRTRFEPSRWLLISTARILIGEISETHCPKRKALAVVQYQKSLA